EGEQDHRRHQQGCRGADLPGRRLRPGRRSLQGAAGAHRRGEEAEVTGALTRLGVHRIPVPVPFPEAGGPANVYVIEEKDGRTARRLELYAAYLSRLGAPPRLLEHVRIHWQDALRMARPLEHVEPLPAGTILRFKRFSAEVLHLPGHTPGLICLWAPEARVLFSDDHLLERVSPNPLLDLEGQVEPTHKALVAYVE